MEIAHRRVRFAPAMLSADPPTSVGRGKWFKDKSAGRADSPDPICANPFWELLRLIVFCQLERLNLRF